MRLEHFSGIYGAQINPAHTAFMPHNWEISLFNADVFVNNNYGYLRQTSLIKALKNSDNILSVTEISPERPAPPGKIIQDFFNRDRKLFAQVQARLGGPAFSFRVGEKHVFGMTSALRAGLSSYRAPEILQYSVISNLPRNQVNEIPAVKIAGMAWAEIGLHYSHKNADGDYTTAFGISPKILLGLEGFYTRASSSFDYTQQIGDTSAFGRARWEYGLTTQQLDNQAAAPQWQINGSGLGLDIGYSIALPDDAGAYRWRLGASVTDAGWVSFKKQAQSHEIAFDTVIRVSPANFPPRSDAQSLIYDVSRAFLSDSSASLRNNSFAVGLPTTLSLQADIQVMPMLYVGAVWMQRVPLRTHSLRRPNTLAFVPRLEHRWFSASIPVVISDWQSMRVGLAARLGVLYIGTDDLGGFTGKKRLTGADFYVGLKINAFSLHFGKWNIGSKRSGGGSSKRNIKKVKCYTF
jgi:hypothetical protein